MALNKVNIPVAAGSKTHMDLSGFHQTTMNFLQSQPIFYRHCIKGESINLSTLATIRPVPMAVPSFGRCRLNIRFFYVPWYLVFPQWSHFRQDTIGSDYNSSSLISNSPKVTNDTLVTYFTTGFVVIGGTNYYLAQHQSSYTQDDSDFSLENGDWYRFTTEGRKRIKILEALGYEINWDTKDNTPYSALALLSFGRAYLDWYTNSQYLDSAAVKKLEQLFSFNNPSGQLNLTFANLTLLLDLVTTCVYDSDSYFNQAWDNPNSPINSQSSLFTFADITQHITSNHAPAGSVIAGTVSSYDDTTPTMYQVSASSTYIGTQYLHDALRKLQNFQKRHQLAGARVIDRALADAGFASDFDRIMRATYIGGTSVDINVGDIYSTADTAGQGEVSTLGDFAGRSFGQGKKSFDFTADEYGLLLGIGSIIPDAVIATGFDRNNLHLDKSSFFTPDFDGLGVQDIQKREVWVNPDGSWGNSAEYAKPFGFSGRYAEYKRPKSWVTGDYRRNSVMRGGKAWSLARFFDDTIIPDMAHLVHSLDFSRGVDWEQYNRIFNNTENTADKFNVDFQFSVSTYSPCKPLFETYDFDEETKKITMDAGGTKLN